MDRAATDIVVVGAGVIGLAVARALSLRGFEVIVVEANPAIGMETSSRSSEVVHAGLYYPPGSLKARTCVQGRDALYAYCRQKGVPHRRIGKLVLATAEREIPRLQSIRANAGSCGVGGLEWHEGDDVARIEPAVRAHAALWSPDTGIIDSHALMLALQGDFEAAGGIVACNTRVAAGASVRHGLELRLADHSSARMTAGHIVNAAGLGAARLALAFDGIDTGSVPRVHHVRGHYFRFAGRSPFNHLVYPLPSAGGLGIHATLDLAGGLRFGPDSEYMERIDYAFDETRAAGFAQSIATWYPGLETARLQPGYTGIRPRLAGPGDGFRDFHISGPDEHGIPGLINLFGIESPGLTACLALAEEVARCVVDPDRRPATLP